MRTRTRWAIALLLTPCAGCTEYLGPAASPSYWRTPAPEPTSGSESEPGPEALVPPGPVATEADLAPELVRESAPEPRQRARSIHLGYTGDGVLAGGITRDTVIAPREPGERGAYSSWQEYVNAPKWRSAPSRFVREAYAAAYPAGYPAAMPMPFVPGCACNRTQSW